MSGKKTWHALTDGVPNGTRFRIVGGAETVTFARLFDLLEGDYDFSAWYTRLLASAESAAFFWEHPALCEWVMDQAAEFVLIDAPALAARRADPYAFRPHFVDAGGDAIAVFQNLGADALLLAPCALTADECYAHLATFVRGAPPGQIRDLWRQTARQLKNRLSDQPVWLSTSGLGVTWLHVRIDRQPKYYQHIAYKASGVR